LKNSLPLVALLFAACALSAPSNQEVKLLPDGIETLRNSLLLSDSAALEAANKYSYATSNSVALERHRQNLLLEFGLRNQCFKNLADWKQRGIGNPADLYYLESRIYSSPTVQLRRFEEGLKRWPHHPWLVAGYSITRVAVGNPNLALLDELLANAYVDADSGPMVRRAKARVLAHKGQVQAAINLLWDDALVHSNPGTLREGIYLATKYSKAKTLRLWNAELKLLSTAPDASTANRCAIVAERCVAQLQYKNLRSLDRLCQMLNQQSQRLALPGGWEQLPRLDIGPLGSLVRPDLNADEHRNSPFAVWLEAGFVPILGYDIRQGVEFLLLSGVQRVEADWPSLETPLQLLVAKKAWSNRENNFSGATIFNGFYIREDMLDKSPTSLVNLQKLQVIPEDHRFLHHVVVAGELPENDNLAYRLKQQCLNKSELDPTEFLIHAQWQQLIIHESCHLPDILPLVVGDADLADLLADGLKSFFKVGDVMSYLEVQAQARAIAISPNPRWALAKTILAYESGPSTYQQAYDYLLKEFSKNAQSKKSPRLANWDLLSDQQITQLAEEFCTSAGIELPNRDSVLNILAKIRSAEYPK